MKLQRQARCPLHAGFTRADDYPPEIYYNEPIKTGQFRGELLVREEYEKMLDEYYETKGWDLRTSWQVKEHLHQLGLPEVVEKLREVSRFPR